MKSAKKCSSAKTTTIHRMNENSLKNIYNYTSYRLTAAAKIPMLVSLGGMEEWPGAINTLSFTVAQPFSLNPILQNQQNTKTTRKPKLQLQNQQTSFLIQLNGETRHFMQCFVSLLRCQAWYRCLFLTCKAGRLNIMFLQEYKRLSQCSRSFEATDDSIKNSQALVQDKQKPHATLLQNTYYVHCPLCTTDLWIKKKRTYTLIRVWILSNFTISKSKSLTKYFFIVT